MHLPVTILLLLCLLMRAYMLLQVLDQLGMEGVLILEVPAGTPAAAAALRPTYRDVFGDIVLGDIIVGESAL